MRRPRRSTAADAANGGDPGGDQEGRGGGRTEHRVRHHVAAASPAGYLNFGDRGSIPAVRGAAGANFHRDTVACPHPGGVVDPSCVQFGPGAGSENSSPAGHREIPTGTRRHAHLRHAQSRPVVLGGSEDTRYRASLNYMNQQGGRSRTASSGFRTLDRDAQGAG